MIFADSSFLGSLYYPGGATHFLSFDSRTRQRRFARACGLKLLPERLPAER